jgi:hypothetical protein
VQDANIFVFAFETGAASAKHKPTNNQLGEIGQPRLLCATK